MDAWFRTPVLVEEKLDGANVSLWVDGGGVRVALRGGADTMDRAGQLGRLRAWAAERREQLVALLDDGCVAYGERLWLEHSVRYDRLPDWLVLLDLWSRGRGMLDVRDRDEKLARHGLAAPPVLFEGVLATRDVLLDVIGPSRFGSEPMEGVVLRGANRAVGPGRYGPRGSGAAPGGGGVRRGQQLTGRGAGAADGVEKSARD